MKPTARKADAGFAISVYDQSIIEDNAQELADPRAGAGVFVTNGLLKPGGEISRKGWDLLNEDIRHIEKNAMVWMKNRFLGARDEGHDSYGDLVGTFYFNPHDPGHAHLVDLAANTGRQERIDFQDLGYGDFALTAFSDVSDFGKALLGGGITFFDVKPEDMEVIENTLKSARRFGRPKQSSYPVREQPMNEYGFATRRDAATAMADAMNLDPDAVYQALGDLRQQFGRWESLRGDEYHRVSRLVWDYVTGADYPYREPHRTPRRPPRRPR